MWRQSWAWLRLSTYRVPPTVQIIISVFNLFLISSWRTGFGIQSIFLTSFATSALILYQRFTICPSPDWSLNLLKISSYSFITLFKVNVFSFAAPKTIDFPWTLTALTFTSAILSMVAIWAPLFAVNLPAVDAFLVTYGSDAINGHTVIKL